MVNRGAGSGYVGFPTLRMGAEMKMKFFAAAAASTFMAAMAGSAGAVSIVSSDRLWALSNTTFGAGTGVHFVNGQGGQDITQTYAQINPADNAVLIYSTDTFDVTGQGEANVADGNGANADPY